MMLQLDTLKEGMERRIAVLDEAERKAELMVRRNRKHIETVEAGEDASDHHRLPESKILDQNENEINSGHKENPTKNSISNVNEGCKGNPTKNNSISKDVKATTAEKDQEILIPDQAKENSIPNQVNKCDGIKEAIVSSLDKKVVEERKSSEVIVSPPISPQLDLNDNKVEVENCKNSKESSQSQKGAVTNKKSENQKKKKKKGKGNRW